MTKDYQEKLIEMAEEILPTVQKLLTKEGYIDAASEVSRLLGFILALKEDGKTQIKKGFIATKVGSKPTKVKWYEKTN